MSSTKQQKGISLLFVVLIMGVILAIGLGISGILVQQTRMAGEIGYSVVSFYAADSGIEQELYDLYKLPEDEHSPGYPGNIGGASYEVVAKCGNKNEECPSGFDYDSELNAIYQVKSVGTYQATKRAIEIEY